MIFDLYSIERETGKKITGAIHVGAFVGEELNQYRNLGLCNTILFEPQPNLYKIVKDKCLIGEKSIKVIKSQIEIKNFKNIFSYIDLVVYKNISCG